MDICHLAEEGQEAGHILSLPTGNQGKACEPITWTQSAESEQSEVTTAGRVRLFAKPIATSYLSLRSVTLYEITLMAVEGTD